MIRSKDMLVKSNLYKGACQLSIMGATEALQFLDVLYKHRLLSRRTVAQYVVPTLLEGKGLREGTPGYEAMEERVYNEVFDEMLGNIPHAVDDPGEGAVSNESYFYMRKIIATAVDGAHRLSINDPPYNGFSSEAYEEVWSLLGRRGRRYLGIGSYTDRLSMKRSIVHAIIIEDGEGDFPDMSLPLDFGPDAPLVSDPPPFADEPQSEVPGSDWKPEEPWMEPFPQSIGQGVEGDPRDYSRRPAMV